MYKTIYVFSPTAQATGGTELLQQLVYKLRLIGQEAYMMYTAPYEGSKVQEVFEPRYNNPHVENIEDSADNIIIVSEAAIYYLLNYKYVQKAIWWLSVDFYGGSFRLPCDTLHKIFYTISDWIYRKYDKEWIHFVQSEYAYNYCIEERGIPADHVVRMSDYLSQAFIANGCEDDGSSRKNQVLYNPKKGIEFTRALMTKAPDIKWIPIINMTSQQIVDLMKESKVYIDFGNHPGKDRIPREATICGCCIITGKRGAAANTVDIPLPDKYKYEESETQSIINAIHDIFNNFARSRTDYVQYVNRIKKEEAIFENEIKEFFIDANIENVRHSAFFQVKQRIYRHIAYAMKFIPALLGHK